MSTSGSTPIPRVVVVGAGFAGLWAAQGLRHEILDLTLLDRNNFHTFYPLLYQVAAAELGPTDIAYPVRSILREGCVRFRMAEVQGLDLDARRVDTSEGPIPYDVLVLAMGSVPAYFGVEGAEEYAYPLRDMDHALPLRREVLSRFEQASFEPDPERRRALLTFVIVGGGPTGVEYAGALAELVHGPLLKDYPIIPQDEVRILLLEGSDRVLGGMDESLGRYAIERLRLRRVEVRLGVFVTRIRKDAVELADGSEIHSDTVVWTAGIQGDPVVQSWGLETGDLGRVVVEKSLQVPGRPEVFVAGDLARAVDGAGEPLAQVAPVAVQQGQHLVEAIKAVVAGQPVPEFEYEDPGMLAVIGRNHAVAQVFGGRFKGFPAWVLWALVHVAKLVGFRNRILVLVNWAWNYIFYERSVRLILPIEKDRLAPAGPAGTSD
ncbi:MAG: NAD(P)/FAD-dependent oxidoreductase, partial [Gemmatimonadetes bacterium]|nr:NAD(P)/FAD-dependent oxidoreductase [Gemmatimonadota bacterium]